MRVALAVVDDGLALHRLGRTIAGDLELAGPSRREHGRLQAGERHPRVAARDLDQVVERLVRDLHVELAQAALGVLQGPHA